MPFSLTDLDGRVRTLEAEAGRPLLVHFFATWCEPCKAELSTLQQFFASRGHEVGVLAINVGEVPARVLRFIDTTPVSFPVLLDQDRAVTKAWAVEGLPRTIVLDKALTPMFAVSGDLDWMHPDVSHKLDGLARAPEPQEAKCQREDRK